MCLLLLEIPQPLFAREAERLVPPRKNAIRKYLVDGDVCAKVKRPREHLWYSRLSREWNDAHNLRWHVLDLAGQNIITALESRREFGLYDGDALVA